MFKEFPFTWGFMTVIIARAERELPSVWLLLLQGAVQKPCHLSHRTETLWRKTNAAFFSLSLSLKKKLLNCLKKSDSDLQKSFLLVCLATVRRTDPYNGMSEGLIQISSKDWKINPFSPNVVVKGLFQCQFLILKVRSRPPFSLFHEEYLCYTPSPHPNERKHEETEQHRRTC